MRYLLAIAIALSGCQTRHPDREFVMALLENRTDRVRDPHDYPPRDAEAARDWLLNDLLDRGWEVVESDTMSRSMMWKRIKRISLSSDHWDTEPWHQLVVLSHEDGHTRQVEAEVFVDYAVNMTWRAVLEAEAARGVAVAMGRAGIPRRYWLADSMSALQRSTKGKLSYETLEDIKALLEDDFERAILQ